jgi:hypothetical protein
MNPGVALALRASIFVGDPPSLAGRSRLCLHLRSADEAVYGNAQSRLWSVYEVVKRPYTTDDQFRAAEKLMDGAYGRPAMAVQVDQMALRERSRGGRAARSTGIGA